MILTFAEDFSSTVELDSQLSGTPESGYFFNQDVHPLVTIDNILSFTPKVDITFTAYNPLTTYGKFEDTRKKSDIVSYESKIYESIAASNLGHTPTTGDYWVETNLNSLRIKNLVYNSKKNMLSALSLENKLIENQQIYNIGESDVDLSADWSGWVFEPKGSDYVKITINQMCLQANTTDTVDVYVINQGVLKETITLNPNNGIFEFEDVGYTISGKGRFYFVFESQSVKTDHPYNDSLKYKGFVCYPVNGTGTDKLTAVYSKTNAGNGLGFNVSATFDATAYINNTLKDFAKLWQLQFCYDFLQMMLHNANNQISGDVRRLRESDNSQMLKLQTMDLNLDTISYKRNAALKEAKQIINRTYDNFLKVKTGIKITRRTI